MGPEMVVALTGLSAVATGASVYSRAQGESAAMSFQSEKAKRAADAGRTAAAETDAFLRQELRETLGNIVATRASANVDPFSPTGQAIIDEETRVSDRERRIRVGNILRQAEDDEFSGRYYQGAAKQILRTGTFEAFSAGTGRLLGRA
jgi:hypothetical protein